MTRLTSDDIAHINLFYLKDYNSEFKARTGKTLLEFAQYLIEDEKIDFGKIRSAVVPITSGKGIIPGFSEAVFSILKFIGCKVFITTKTDIAGFFEAFQKKVDLIFAADDELFSVFNLGARKAIENSFATGKAYAAALELVAKNIENKEVLVIGVGKVGISAIKYFLEKKARVVIFDRDKERLKLVKKEFSSVRIESNLDSILPEIKLILIAAPAKDLIQEHHVNYETIIACPAIPIGVTKVAWKMIKPTRFIHDPLQLGVISMLALSIKNKS